MTLISPSILAADLANLGDEVKSIKEAEADMVHIDVMDGAFVPNISFGLPLVESLRKCTDMFFDVHLMIVEPEKYAERFIFAGADLVTFHYEATENAEEIIETVKKHNKKVGVSIKPATPVEKIIDILPKVDVVLIMTVEPGFGGQKILESQIEKVRELKSIIHSKKIETLIEVDGGINGENASELTRAGADIIVAGSYVFNSDDRKKAISSLR